MPWKSDTAAEQIARATAGAMQALTSISRAAKAESDAGNPDGALELTKSITHLMSFTEAVMGSSHAAA